jgi:hypothetical protein
MDPTFTVPCPDALKILVKYVNTRKKYENCFVINHLSSMHRAMKDLAQSTIMTSEMAQIEQIPEIEYVIFI